MALFATVRRPETEAACPVGVAVELRRPRALHRLGPNLN